MEIRKWPTLFCEKCRGVFGNIWPAGAGGNPILAPLYDWGGTERVYN